MSARQELESSLVIQALSMDGLRKHMTKKVAPLVIAAATVLGTVGATDAQAQQYNKASTACGVAGGALGGYAGYAAGKNNGRARSAMGVAGAALGAIGGKMLCDMVSSNNEPSSAARGQSPTVARALSQSSEIASQYGGASMSSADMQGMNKLARNATQAMERWIDAEQYASRTRMHNSNEAVTVAFMDANRSREQFVFEARNFERTVNEMSSTYDVSRFRTVNTMLSHMASVAERGNYGTYEDLKMEVHAVRNERSMRPSSPTIRF